MDAHFFYFCRLVFHYPFLNTNTLQMSSETTHLLQNSYAIPYNAPIIVNTTNAEERERSPNKAPLYISGCCTLLVVIAATILLAMFFVYRTDCIEDSSSISFYFNLGTWESGALPESCYTIITFFWISVCLYILSCCGCCVMCCISCGYAFSR